MWRHRHSYILLCGVIAAALLPRGVIAAVWCQSCCLLQWSVRTAADFNMTSELLRYIAVRSKRSCITELWCQSCCVSIAACQHCCITAVGQQQGRWFTAVWVSELLLYCSVVLKLLQHWSMTTGPLIHYCVLVRWHYWSRESAPLLLLYCSVVSEPPYYSSFLIIVYTIV